jgi:TrmH family RNA methyltransferase
MPVRVVESKDNARLKELRKALTQPPHAGEGLVAIEGPHLVFEALSAGLKVETVFVAREFPALLDLLRLPEEVDVLQLPRKHLESALSTEAPQPIVALVRPPHWDWEDLLGTRRRDVPLVLVLAALQDPGNLGTILRSAEAFGCTGIIALPGTVSPWNPKALRATAGSAFRLPFLQVPADEWIPRLHGGGLSIWSTAAHNATHASTAALAKPVAIIIGNEGSGVPSEIAARADGTLTIPTPGPVESLNAAVAASILLYEAARQREMSPGRRRPTGGRR